MSVIDDAGVSLTDGTRIEAATVVWTAGLEASPLTSQVSGERDLLGRLHVTPELRVMGQNRVFAAGDTAYAATDGQGHHALMSCQHAMTLGRVAGHNAAADLLGVATVAHNQPRYAPASILVPGGGADGGLGTQRQAHGP